MYNDDPLARRSGGTYASFALLHRCSLTKNVYNFAGIHIFFPRANKLRNKHCSYEYQIFNKCIWSRDRFLLFVCFYLIHNSLDKNTKRVAFLSHIRELIFSYFLQFRVILLLLDTLDITYSC